MSQTGKRSSLNLSSLIQNKAAMERYGPLSTQANSVDDSMHSINSSIHSELGLLPEKVKVSSKPSEVKKKGSKPLPTDLHHHKFRYEMWEGKNKFLLNGRVMMGVHTTHLVGTLTLLVLTYILFLGVLVPLTGIPLFDYIGLILFVLNISLLLLTAFTEPGIIPRRPPTHNAESEAAMNGLKDKLQFCNTCHIVRPPRAKHCRYCDNCVEVFDHHCPWTGTCIGVRNYKYFINFVTVTVIGAVFCCSVSAYVIVLWAEGVHSDLVYVRDTVSPLLCSWTLVVSLLVGALLVFHIFLISRGQTTNEFLRGAKLEKDGGGCANFFKVCCAPVSESKLLPMWDEPTAEDDIYEVNVAVKSANKEPSDRTDSEGASPGTATALTELQREDV